MISSPALLRLLLLLLLSPLLPLALAQSSPTAPTTVPCPKSLIRSGTSLSPSERAYTSSRTQSVLPAAWKSYLSSVRAALPPGTALPGYVGAILDPPAPPRVPFLPPRGVDQPTLGIALSGGGLRAAYFAAGVLTALDARNTTVPSGSNGLLQSATYLSALSGGAWLATALAQADFPTIPELVFPALNPPASEPPANPESRFGGLLNSLDLLAPGANAAQNGQYIQALLTELAGKAQAGLPVTLTDVWTRAIGRHFVNGTTPADILEPGAHGDGITFSGLQDLPSIKAHAQPFPIVLWNAIPPALIANPNDPAQLKDLIPGNSVPVGSEIWEVNMFETGSWDPTLASFIPTRLLGSTPAFTTGSGRTRTTTPAVCRAGVDQAAYVAGVSSNVFNGLNVTQNLLPLTQEGQLISLVNATFPSPVSVRLDSGALPNPFRGVNPKKYPSSPESFLAVVDGGSNGEVLPLQPLILKSRGVDVIYAIDAPADLVTGYANGSDLVNAASRAARFPSLYTLPRLPASPTTFIAQNLTLRPTLFGCSPEDEKRGAPIVVYVANGGASRRKREEGVAGATGVPTAVTAYSDEMAQTFMDESFDIATQGLGLGLLSPLANTTEPGAQWSTCLACAVVDRARARRGVKREGVCVDCFRNYCWDGRE